MMMQQRLSILAENAVISQTSYQASIAAAALIEAELKLEPDSEQFQMLVTHLARATDRILLESPIEEGLDDDIWQEIVESDQFDALQALNMKVLDLYGIEQAPQTENSFLVSNLFAISQLTDDDR